MKTNKQKYVYNKHVSLEKFMIEQGSNIQVVHSGLGKQYKYLYGIFGSLYDCPWCDVRMQPLSVGMSEWGAKSECPRCKNPIKFDCYGIISGQWDILPVTKNMRVINQV